MSTKSFTTNFTIPASAADAFIWAHEHAGVVQSTPESEATFTDHLSGDELVEMIIQAGMPDPL